MKTAYQRLRGVDIWVQAEAPMIYDSAAHKYNPPTGFIIAFKYHQPPGVIVGEYLRNLDGTLKWFSDQDDGIAAGFEEAVGRIPPSAAS